MQNIQQLQTSLMQMRHVACYSHCFSGSKTGWSGVGVAKIVPQLQTASGVSRLTLNEAGTFYLFSTQHAVTFSNRIRLVVEDAKLFFERCRGKPQFERLFELKYITARAQFISHLKYYCGMDSYHLTIVRKRDAINMLWRIIGVNKNEYIQYHYYS